MSKFKESFVVIAIIVLLVVIAALIVKNTIVKNTIHTEAKEVEPSEPFVVIEQWDKVLRDDKFNSTRCTYQIMYDKETKVEYLLVTQPDGCSITPLYQEDGSPKIYEEKGEK